MKHCKVFPDEEAIWAWQPFGPDESFDSFSLLGSHYRGFPVVPVSDKAKRWFQGGNTTTFEHRGHFYQININGNH